MDHRLAPFCRRWLSRLYAQAVQRVRRIDISKLFDSDYYLARYPDVARANLDPLAHFLLYGAAEGRQPHPLFDPAFYAAGNPVIPRGANALVHYLREGWKEDRRPNRWFDPVFYRTIHKLPADVPPLLHYIDSIRAGRPGTALRDLSTFLPASPEPPRMPAQRRPVEIILTPAESVADRIRQCPESDIVLLHARATVSGDWLDRLAACCYSDPRAGTATPFTSSGGSFSYPRFDSQDPALIDSMMSQMNARRSTDVPGVGGHCSFLRRDCLDDAGAFDPSHPEEFCRRAMDKGWRHLLAADVFVGMPETAAPSGCSRHGMDPAWPFRIAASAALIKRSGKPVILNISHSAGGGIDEAIRKSAENSDAVMLILQPDAGGIVWLRNTDDAHPFDVWADLSTQYSSFLLLLRSFGVSRIHIHHLMGHGDDIRRIVEDLGVPVDFTIHDYFTVCPQITLTDSEGRYCGEPDEAACNECIRNRPSGAVDIVSWRERHSWMVTRSQRVIAPSKDTADRFRRYFPQASIEVKPHEPALRTSEPAARPAAPGQALRIAVLGAMTAHKGLENLRECAALARRRGLPLEFTLIGDVNSRLPFAFRKTGKYDAGELDERVRRVDPHLVWFPGQAPETYSFTLSFCLKHGLPVAAPDIGAFPGRLAGRKWTWILPWESTPEQWLAFFTAVQREHFHTGD